MTIALRSMLLYSCLVAAAAAPLAFAQEQPSQQQPAPAAQPAATETAPLGLPFGVTLSYWLTRQQPTLKQGYASTETTPGNLKFPGKGKATPGLELNIPVGGGSALRMSYFRTQGSGNTVASGPLALFSTGFDQGDYLATSSTLQSVKISFDYLSYPFPVGRSKFRLKTLWGVQYTNIKSSIDAPLKLDSSGTPAPASAQGSKYLIYPSLGLGLEQYTSSRFHWLVRGSGFGVPRHADQWDAEAEAYLRVSRHFGAVAGYKAFHVKTSPKRDAYFSITLSGAYVGLRWTPE